ncbi:T6SS immunity protein Tdi1 domain-containing protein [uncultured Erythrobacter sp.]|uniref:T6SS immunity protein Tdi1 domain-containing protein n=1 Tax=uncultured Erythrobacter sp. TaxID=263913 RepID=UPI0026277750|nr:T6SS immunity protein Tdi1 domain-containing protein [uncultured Erythrobacter sp.]
MFKKLFGAGKPEPLQTRLDPRFTDGSLSEFFIKVSAAKIDGVMGDWGDLKPAGTVIAVTAFGDLFVTDADGNVAMLDTIEGKLNPVAESPEQLLALLEDEQKQDELLLAGFVLGARSDGKTLGEGECYDFTPPPILGGPMTPENFEVTDFVVKMSIAGQIFVQVKDLPPGTKIGEIKITD